MPITSYPITTIGNCNTAFSMMVIGMILASKYGCDEIFAAKLVVASTILSMVTIPVWNMIQSLTG